MENTYFIKKTIILFAIIGMTTMLFAQTPNSFKYQSVARDNVGAVLNTQNITIQISINESGSAIYTEDHAATTNQFGLFNLNIGTGNVTLGDFTNIDWSTGTYSVEVSMDENAGTSYTVMGTSPLLTVPYAMHAKTAENTFSGDYGDLANTPTLPESTSDLLNDSGFITNPDDADADTTNEIQTLEEVLIVNNSANSQIKDLIDPSDVQDAATKAYVDLLEEKVNDMETQLYASGALTLTDVDGNTYNVAQIGTQLWMAENLKTTKFNDGTDIYNETDPTIFVTLNTPAYCWYDNDSATYVNPYGALYNYYAVETGNLCPNGWRVSEVSDWDTLSNFLGGSTIAGNEIKEQGTAHWSSTTGSVTNSSGFTAVGGGGLFDPSGVFLSITDAGYYWTATNATSTTARRIYLGYNTSNVHTISRTKVRGYSVRCIKN